MHFIDRSGVPAPSCLAELHATRCTWKDVTHEQRDEIRESLKRLDESRCAYCEVYVEYPHCHIEHFQSQARSVHPRFEWGNLFLSCNQKDTCGKHKGNSETQHLIKPDEEDPERYFQFYADGTIRIRQGLGDKDKHRAEETLRVFNLRDGRLRKMRELAVQFYLDSNHEILEFLDSTSAVEREEFLQDAIRERSKDEYVTTIKHFLQSLLRANAE